MQIYFPHDAHQKNPIAELPVAITLSILQIGTCVISLWKAMLQGLHFVYLHLRSLNNLWGRYDTKTKNKTEFCF